MADVQRFDGSSWVDVDHQSWEIKNGIHETAVAPTATVTTHAQQTVNANEQWRIRVDSSTIFEGRTASAGKIGENGLTRVPVNGYGQDLFSEAVSLSETSPTDADVMNAALSASERGGQFTLSYGPTPISLGDDYDVTDRPVRSVFRDMMDRGGRVWWVDHTKTIHVQNRGGRGTWQTVETGTDDAVVREYDPGEVETVVNDVTVNGTGDQHVVGTATDSTSISEFGKRSEVFNYSYIISQSEANAMASELLVPDPLESAKLLVAPSVGNPYQNLANYQIDVTDDSKNISNAVLTVTEQTVSEGRVELKLGAGSGVDMDRVNRKGQSGRDTTTPGSVYGENRIADGSIAEPKLQDLAVSIDKIQDAAVAEAKVRQDAISETKITDSAVTTPKINAGSITSGKIDSAAVDTIHLAADAVTAGKILAGEVGAEEIAANSITADEIDVLDLSAGQITIGDSDDYFQFDVHDTGGGVEVIRMLPNSGNNSWLGDGSLPFGFVYTDSIRFDGAVPINGDDTGHVGQSGQAYSEMHVYDITAYGGVDSRPTINPSSDNTGSIGQTNQAWDSMRAHNFITASPDPDVDVDLDELKASGWYDPPQYVRDGTPDPETPEDTATDGGVTQDHGEVELGAMLNYVLEVCKAQQERIEELENQNAE